MKSKSLVDEILIRRGLKTAAERRKFLNPDYLDLHDPSLLPDMDRAVKRIKKALLGDQLIAIYGDYDIDGLSATALLIDALTAMGGKVLSYIPDRFDEGYGINQPALAKLRKAGAKLVITVDCGSTSIEPIAWAKAHNLDVIVTDHHELSAHLPPALAIINPKRADSRYPFNDLAGVGVAFKLVQALGTDGLLAAGQEKWLLDLVALGTVCDVVGLVDENRIIVHYGLKVLAKTKRPGLRALMKVGGVSEEISSYHLGFVLGPRLNAAGRLEHAEHALRLLMSRDEAEAEQAAQYLNELNLRRRVEQAQILAAAMEQAEQRLEDKVLVLADARWSHGIVGIVAAKLVEKYRKPVLLLQILGDEAKGSARSLGEYNIVSGLKAAENYLLKFGGHHFAAGCTLKTENVERLRRSLNEHYQNLGLVDQDRFLDPQEEVALDDLGGVDWELLKDLDRLAPFGRSNPRPIIRFKAMQVKEPTAVGSDRQHLKLKLCDANGVMLSAIGFGLSDWRAHLQPDQSIDTLGELERNDYNGYSSLQVQIKKIDVTV